MYNKILNGFFLFILLAAFIGCEHAKSPLPTDVVEKEFEDQSTISSSSTSLGGKIVVANRASGSISVISVMNDVVVGTYPLPSGSNPAEPMYVVYNYRNRTVFVGDRGNDRVVAYDADNFSVKTMINAGSGVFHIWADPRGKQLWVNNDIHKTMTVINPRSLNVITTVPIPADLSALNGKPHDVILDPTGKFAYVSILGIQGNSDFVVQYSTRTFSEIGRAAVGKDPHLSLTQKNDLLYVPCQNSNAVYILNRYSMNVEDILSVPGAHGAGMPVNGETFYTTNLPGGGADGLWAIDVSTNSVIGNTDTPYPIPHNIALTPKGDKLYVTHSGGSSNKVTIFKIPKGKQVPEFLGEVNVGFNPFGLAFVY